MLDSRSSLLSHICQNIALIYLSLVFLPINTFILKACQYYEKIAPSRALKQRDTIRSDAKFQERTILVTGVAMTKGLVLARLFHQAGHRVIAADFEAHDLPLASGRVSKSVARFYHLSKPTSSDGSAPYIQSLLDTIEKENVELWVSCSGVASAVADGEAKQVIEARTRCKAIQYDVAMTQTLHEKHSFIEYTKELGLNVPDTHTITSRSAVQSVLSSAPKGRKYIMKPTGMDDANRGDMTLLPKSSPQATNEHLSNLSVDQDNPWILQQFISGKEFCTHALVIKGTVRAFVACPSAELLMHYEALPPSSPLSDAMLQFTQVFASKSGSDFTGHLSFDFLVEPEHLNANKAEDVVLWPIECNPRAHTAVVLFNDTLDLVDAYISLLTPYKEALLNGTPAKDNEIVYQSADQHIVKPLYSTRYKYYWLPHDLIALVVLPVLSFLTLRLSLIGLLKDLKTFAEHLLFWHDGTLVFWDPMPAWWLWHIQWPGLFTLSLWSLIFGQGETGRRAGMWSRINVSTGKMFGC